MYDVIVVGAGPAGSYTARRLAEKGHRLLVLEAKARAGEKYSCTGIVGWEFIKTYNIPQNVILRQANSAMVFSPSGNRLHLYRKEPQACILDRTAFDVYMAEQAQKAGTEYLFNSHVTDILIKKDCAEVFINQENKETRFSAKAVVIAAGYNPGLIEKAGLGGFKDHVTGAQAEVEAPGLEEVEVYFGDIAPGFFAWLVPTFPGKAKAGLLSRKEPGILLKKWLEELAAQGRIASADVNINYGTIPLKPPTRTYNDRLIAAGDAAGHTKPTSGGGIYYGIIGADAGIEVLDKALAEGDLTKGRLADYERAWRRKLGGELRTGYRARRLYERLSNKTIDFIFKAMKTSGIDEALVNADDLSFDWHSRTIKSLFKYRVITKTLKIIKLPFTRGDVDR